MSYGWCAVDLIESKCCRCHKPGKEKGGLDLQSLLPKEQGHLRSPQKWKRAWSYLKSHEMPPQDSKKISLEDRENMTVWLEDSLSKTYMSIDPEISALKPRRLNKQEYQNTLQDLLYLSKAPSLNLPSDNSGYGFDNIAELLSVTSLSMEKYLKYSKQVLDQAILDELPQHKEWTFDVESMTRLPKASGRVIEDVHHVWANGSLSVNFTLKHQGKYRIQMKAEGDQAGDEKVQVEIAVNDKKLKTIDVSAEETKAEGYSLDVDLEPGTHKVKVSFINDYNHPLHGDRNFHFHNLKISGPQKLPAIPQSHQRLVPKDQKFDVILKRFMERAYRRPVSVKESESFNRVYKELRAQGDGHLKALKSCFLAVLVSPKFLFRVEQKPKAAITMLNDYELASRLSYFLWSSMPDERLFHLAQKNDLNKVEVLRTEVKRMLESYRAKQFVKNFSGQWLQVRNLEFVDVSNRKFPAWNGGLKESMKMEVYAYFSYVLENNLPLSFFIRGYQLFINEKLAKHYGVKGKYQWNIKAVPAFAGRDSILSTASVLTVTSEASRTSPVKRGKWILEEMLGFTPPPPPPGVSALEEGDENHVGMTISQQLAKHREDPDCAVCHLRMDPLGLSFENYNPIGQWRDTYELGKAIDLGGRLPDGSQLSGLADVQNYLMNNETEFQHTVIEKLMIYALGRGLEPGDYRTLYEIHQKTLENSCRLEDVIIELVLSKVFRYKS